MNNLTLQTTTQREELLVQWLAAQKKALSLASGQMCSIERYLKMAL